MKKFLSAITAMVIMMLSADAQQRIALNELFTGENCSPCGYADPILWQLLNTPANPSKVIDLTYMEPIPTSGWYYMQTRGISDARISYYSEIHAPTYRFDGRMPHGDDNPLHLTQHLIDSEYAVPSNFILSVTTTWNSTYDSIIATVTIDCPTTPFAGTSVYLRTALTSTLTG